ncbi:hypothetical protein [Nostoc sp.]|uniref:hypothetical protein n=1 Tax=Nostoc sp. TaxID=1180 RepID=UPI002FFC4462
MRQGFFSIVPPLNLITQALNSECQAFFSELHALNSERRAFFSELHALNSECQAFFSELHALNSERRAFFSELHALNLERRAFFSEPQALNSECQAFFSIRRVRRLGNLNFAENRSLFHSTNLFCVWTYLSLHCSLCRSMISPKRVSHISTDQIT